MQEDGTEAQAPGAPEPEQQSAARRLWRHDPVIEQRVARFLAQRSWLRGKRGVQLPLETIAQEALSASPDTARRVLRRMVAKGRVEIMPQRDPYNRPEPNVYVLLAPEYTGSGPPAPPTKDEPDAATSGSQLADKAQRSVINSRDHSTTNDPGSARLSSQNTHGDKPAKRSRRVAAPEVADEEPEDR